MVDYHDAGIWEQISAMLSKLEVRVSKTCGRVICSPDWNWRPRLTDFDLWFAVKGRGSLLLNGHSYRIEAGSLLFLRPDDTGFATQDIQNPLTVLYAHFNFLSASQITHLLPSVQINFVDSSRFETLLGRLVALKATNQPLAILESELILKQALLEIYRQDAANQGLLTARIEPRFERVIARLRAHPQIRPTLSEAASWIGLSPTHFSRLFSQQTGSSYREYLLKMRLEQARYLLKETDMSITKIASELGYENTALFSRQFKAVYGLAPRAFRLTAV